MARCWFFSFNVRFTVEAAVQEHLFLSHYIKWKYSRRPLRYLVFLNFTHFSYMTQNKRGNQPSTLIQVQHVNPVSDVLYELDLYLRIRIASFQQCHQWGLVIFHVILTDYWLKVISLFCFCYWVPYFLSYDILKITIFLS